MKRMIVCAVVANLLAGSAAWGAACILTNGDFIGGDLYGWSYDSSAGSQAPFMMMPSVLSASVGNYPPEAAPTVDDPAMVATLQGVLEGSNWIYQTFPVTTGIQYKLVGKYAGGVEALPADAAASASWEVVLYPGAYDKATTEGGAYVVASTTADNMGSSFGWKSVNTMWTATAIEYTIALKWSGHQNLTSGGRLMGAYFDEFCGGVVPEPATLALLALAAPLLRRRR